MFRTHHKWGGSDTQHQVASLSKSNQWFNPYVNAKAAINHTSSSWIQDPNRPHLNIILDKQHKIKALIDSEALIDLGSSICLAGSSLVEHISNKSTVGLRIHVTECYNHQKMTKGCYQAVIDVEDNLPHPIKDRPINIHIRESLSSELILGTDFLKENGAIIKVRENTVAFLPDRMAAIGKCNKPILKEAVVSLLEKKTGTGTKPSIQINTSGFGLQHTILDLPTGCKHQEQEAFSITI